MDEGEIGEILARTLDDHRLSRGERQALAAKLAGIKTEAEHAQARRMAFETARSAVIDPDSRAVLDWLEDLVKLLHPEARRRDEHPAEAYFSPGDECPRRIAGLLGQARQRVEICVFTITDDRITEAILGAYRRGVALRVVTDNDKMTDEGSDVDRLRFAGVPIRVDRTEYHMHHKFALFDGATLLTGSYNWTRSASLYNDENFIVTGDPQLFSRFAERFERLWGRLA